MLEKVTFIKKFRCFKPGNQITLRSGVNLLVGDQGSGKSSLLLAIRRHSTNAFIGNPILRIDTDKPTQVYAFDFEKDNPRGRETFSRQSDKFQFQLAASFASHGQTVQAILNDLPLQPGMTALMDEPDMALSIRSIKKLIDFLTQAAKEDCQILAAVHNPLLIQAFPQVYSLEHRRWMSAKRFVDLHWSGT